jgi:hypothetical protein
MAFNWHLINQTTAGSACVDQELAVKLLQGKGLVRLRMMMAR